MTSHSEPRTKQRALGVLLNQMATIRATMSGQSAEALLTDQLIAEIFEVAWQHQFDDDRSEAIRQVREIVNIAIDSSKRTTLMIIEKLTMFNFGPFCGEHAMELSVFLFSPDDSGVWGEHAGQDFITERYPLVYVRLRSRTRGA